VTTNTRVSQVVAETLEDQTVNARASQVVTETVQDFVPISRASQVVAEQLHDFATVAHAGQIVLEILVFNHEVGMPLLFPGTGGNPNDNSGSGSSLPGLDISVTWRPKAINAPVQTHASGREVRVAYSQYPLHEFELTFNLLRDRLGETELKTFFGFFLALSGSLNGFCFHNPDDYKVKSQSLATTDGINQQFGPLVRTYGANGFDGTEPVGYVDTTTTFNLYVDGNLVDPHDPVWGYSVLTTQPVAQYIHFPLVPPAGHVLTVDMTYFYYVRFADDTMDFEKFMNRLWRVQKIKLMSLRG
jgi:hypothetical protein